MEIHVYEDHAKQALLYFISLCLSKQYIDYFFKLLNLNLNANSIA